MAFLLLLASHDMLVAWKAKDIIPLIFSRPFPTFIKLQFAIMETL
jgi:hypothetical protein